MQRYFILNINISEKKALLKSSDFHHIKNVMRSKQGDKIIVCNKDDQCFISEITGFTENTVEVVLLQETSNTELPVSVDLAQGLIRRERYEYVLQKASELGVNTIIPVHSKYSIIKLEPKKEKKKIERWNSITKEASEQSHRNHCVSVTPIQNSFKQLDYTTYDHVLIAYEKENESNNLNKVLQTKVKNILIVIGPEGGLHDEEIAFFQTLENAHFVGLGKRILRSETASSYLLSVIGYTYEMSGLE